ncbi:hypothetical protein DVH24_009238 [Malus domestica]|uniref:Uncharacterized protein n=1 Tax=Malus domestica TaxID=3750 RepID=A0A498IRA2_MALDO|nr:hypothetical protein DVH24_009238 [Malus domestica]
MSDKFGPDFSSTIAIKVNYNPKVSEIVHGFGCIFFGKRKTQRGQHTEDKLFLFSRMSSGFLWSLYKFKVRSSLKD